VRGSILAAAALAAAVLACASPAAAAGDAARGRALAEERDCGGCHGENGRSAAPGTPSLAGQPPDFVTLQMILFREGIRRVPPMDEPARGLADTQIEDLAAYYASLPPGPPEDRGPRDEALAARGAELSRRSNCGVCHLPDYRGRAQIPRLAGQREDFLLRTMQEYRDGRRVGSDTSMNAVVYGLSDADLAALAHHLAQAP
jgi:cytochrome c553